MPTGPAGGLLPEQWRTRRVRDLLRGLVLSQTINLPFVSPDELAAFGEVDAAGTAADVVTVRNPLRDDQSKLCQSLLPGLLRKLRENRNRGADWVGLYETGRVFFARPWADDPRVPEQPIRLAIAISGPYGTRRLGDAVPDADATTALGIVAALSDAMDVAIERTHAAPRGYHPTRTAALTIDGRVIGHAGELHPDVADEFELAGRVAVLEMDLDPLVAITTPRQMDPVSTYPHVDFDLSFEVPHEMSAAKLLTVTMTASDLVEQARVFDDYRDAERGLRSIALRYRLRAADRTLEADEIAAERTRMIEQAAAFGATLRGSE